MFAEIHALCIIKGLHECLLSSHMLINMICIQFWSFLNSKIKCNFNVPMEEFTYEFHKEQQVLTHWRVIFVYVEDRYESLFPGGEEIW